MFLRNAIAVIKAPSTYRYPDHERLGKMNCGEARFQRARSMPRSVESVLADSEEKRLMTAKERREPASPQRRNQMTAAGRGAIPARAE